MKGVVMAALLCSACTPAVTMPAIDGAEFHPGMYSFEAQRRTVRPGAQSWSPNVFHPDLAASSAPSRARAASTADGPIASTAWLWYSAYKNTVSRLDGSTCRFSPSCSTFALEAIREHGSLGVAMAFGRLHKNHGDHRHYPTTTPPFLDDPVANYGFWLGQPALDDFARQADDAHAWYQHVRAVERLAR